MEAPQSPCRCEPTSDDLLAHSDLTDLRLNRSGSAIVIILCKKDFFNKDVSAEPKGEGQVEGEPEKPKSSTPQIMKMMKSNALKFMTRVKDRMTTAREPPKESETTEAVGTEPDATKDAEAEDAARGSAEGAARGSAEAASVVGPIPVRTSTASDYPAAAAAEAAAMELEQKGKELEEEPTTAKEANSKQGGKTCSCGTKKTCRCGAKENDDDSSSSDDSGSSSSSFAELTAFHGKSRIRKRANAAQIRCVLSNLFGSEIDSMDSVELRNKSRGSRYSEYPSHRRRQYPSPEYRSDTPSPHRYRSSRRSTEKGPCCRSPKYRPVKGCSTCIVCINCGNKRRQHPRW